MNRVITLAVLLALSIGCTKRDKFVTLEKSSDSEWHISKKNYGDTIITKTIVFGSDTVYPTIQYKRVKL